MAELVKRINELAQKAKTTGLTPEETAERDLLRQQYIAAVRVNIKVLFEFNNARGFSSAVRGYRHKIDLTVAGYRAH